jgi:hypothetical protein
LDERRLQKAFLRYHDSGGWPQLRQALLKMGRKDLIGNGEKCLVPAEGQDTPTPSKHRAKRGQVARGDKRRPLEEIKQERSPRGERKNFSATDRAKSSNAKRPAGHKSAVKGRSNSASKPNSKRRPTKR